MITLRDIELLLHGKMKLFDRLSWQVPEGAQISLIGQNGTGKSTLLGLISGRLLPTGGQILHGDTDITLQSLGERSRFIGQLSQNPARSCAPSLTVAENCALAAMKFACPTLRGELSGVPTEALQSMAEDLDVDIHALWNRPMKFLSGGQQQLIVFMMVMLTNPKVLLLDEPTAALSPAATKRFVATARAFIERDHITTICVTHDATVSEGLTRECWELLPTSTVIRVG